MRDGRTKVTVVGAGVAALEALIAVRGIAEERVDLEMVTPRSTWNYGLWRSPSRPASPS
jgi:hypothetical protein